MRRVFCLERELRKDFKIKPAAASIVVAVLLFHLHDRFPLTDAWCPCRPCGRCLPSSEGARRSSDWLMGYWSREKSRWKEEGERGGGDE